MASKEHLETIDTNVLLSLNFQDQPHQREKTVKMLADPNRFFLIPDVVFIETIRVLTRTAQITRAKAVEVVYKTLTAFYNLSYDTHIVTDVFHDFVAHPALSFEDCYLAYYATKNSAEPLWTFDKKLAAQISVAKVL